MYFQELLAPPCLHKWDEYLTPGPLSKTMNSYSSATTFLRTKFVDKRNALPGPTALQIPAAMRALKLDSARLRRRANGPWLKGKKRACRLPTRPSHRPSV